MLGGAAVFYPGQAGLGIVLLLALHHETGSFAAAGVAGAADTIAFSLSSIVQARLIDRRGARVLIPVTATCALAITAMAAALIAHAGVPVLVGLAGAVGGSIPSAGTSLRTVWSAQLTDPDERASAFAYQSLAQDAGFVIGPATFGAVTTAVSPELALACCAALIVAGASIAATVPLPHRIAPQSALGSGSSPMRALAPLALTLAAIGVNLGAIDVSTAAFATEHHHQAFAGALLGAFAVGSITGGLAYGARSWRMGLKARLLCGTFALAVLSLAAAAAPSMALGAPAFVLAGAPFAATLTTAYLLAAEHAPAGRQTEAFALLSLSLNAGAALGGAFGGRLVSGGSARPGFLLAVAGPLLGVVILLFPTCRREAQCRRRRRASADRSPG